jgi:hypothetical protein
MSIPNFTAQASLYRSSRHYRGSAASSGSSRPGGSIVLAYRPLPATQIQCSECNDSCSFSNSVCNGELVTPLAALCGFSLFTLPGACAAASYAQLYCDALYAGCTTLCLFKSCCPKACGIPDPLKPGDGCCDAGEHCVDQNDPNSRNGCCPSDQSVCGGSCCAKGEFCCGDSCCPPDTFCCGGSCCPSGTPCFSGVCAYPPLIPPGTPPPPPPAPPPPGGCPPGTWYNPLFGCAPIIH